jgi:hypothetical protein
VSKKPFDLSADDTAEMRLLGESTATTLIDGRKRNLVDRTSQVAFKTTLVKRQQLQRLVRLSRMSQVEVIEAALDLFERELNAAEKKGAA